MEETDGKDGSGWTRIGEPHIVPYVGDYKTIAVMDAISLDGQQMFITADKLDTPTFSSFLLEMRREFGPFAMILDRSSVHKSKKLQKVLDNNPDIRLIFLLKGSPQINVTEEIWHNQKTRF